MKYFVEFEYPDGRKNAVRVRPGKGHTLNRLRQKVEAGETIYPHQWGLYGGWGATSSFSTWKTDRIPKQLVELFNRADCEDLHRNKLDMKFYVKTTEGSSRVCMGAII